MSVVLVCLPNAPKVSEEAVRKDTELDKYLESRVEGENGWVETKNQCSLYVQTKWDEYEKLYFIIFIFLLSFLLKTTLEYSNSLCGLSEFNLNWFLMCYSHGKL